MSRSKLLRLLVASLLVTPLLHIGPARAANGQLCGPAGGPSSSFRITEWVNRTETFDAARLATLPQKTVADSFLAGSGSTSRNYTGVELWQLLELPSNNGSIGTLLKPSDPPGPQGPTQRNDITRYSVMITGSDCFQALFSMAEISPFFGGKPVVVATAEGPHNPGDLTTPVTGSLGTSGFARISNPVDLRGSRRVSNIVEIRVLKAPPEASVRPAGAETCPGGPSSSFKITGQVNSEQTYDLTRLQALPQSTVADTFLAGSGSSSANYTGVDLWRLLGLSEANGNIGSYIKPNGPGPQAPAAQKNDLTRYSVMITATDCFQALFSLAEISPFFGGKSVVVATAQGPYNPADLSAVTTLGNNGFARISNPLDMRGSRRVSNILEVRVLRAPTPEVTWPAPTAIAFGTPLDSGQFERHRIIGRKRGTR